MTHDDMTAPTATPLGATAYLAAEDYLEPLLVELGDVRSVHGRLIIADGQPRAAAWAQNIWYDPVLIPIQSIKQGAKALRAIQRNWALYGFQHHRRAQLIQDNLPHVSAKPVSFFTPPPAAPLGSWTLLNENTILAAAHCSSPYRNGEIELIEDKVTPPNRAYLKLWEAFTRIGYTPQPGEQCIDLGACPGGWTWVMQSCGARVIAVDKAPLDPKIAALPGVTERRESAFGIKPADIGPVDWLACDVICYPSRLYRMIQGWLDSGLARNYICTLKFQGETDFETARAFAAIPGSQLVHLCQNKHELTWIKLGA